MQHRIGKNRRITHRRAVLAAASLVASSLALALGGHAGAAHAAEADAWGSFAVTGSARAYTGTLTLPGGFPDTAFTSTSRQATVATGVSTWQAATTPPGEVYGSSRGRPYLNQRPAADNPASPAITTYTFATPTPAGGWSFVLGDIDADQATISATAVDGSAVPIADLGFQGSYNYCQRVGGPSCAGVGLTDVPTWNPATGVLLGNATATDTSGASGWFSPSVPLATLTITYQERSGIPVYQTWFATKTFSPSGTVTVDGTPVSGVPLTIRDAAGAVVGTATSGDDGTWSLPGLVSTSGYTVEAGTPPGAAALPRLTFDTLDADTPGLDFAFTVPTVAVTGTIDTAGGDPAAGQSIVFTPVADGLPEVSTTTDADGGFTADLVPSQPYTAVIGDATDQPIPFTAPATDGPLDAPLVQPAPPVTTPATIEVTGTVLLPSGDPAADETLVFTPDDDSLPPTTVTTDAAGSFTADLFPAEPYTLVVDGAVDRPIRFTSPAAAGPLPVPLVQPASASSPAPPTVPPGPTSSTPAELAMTGSAPAVPGAVAILLALAGGALVIRDRAGRRRARRE